MATEETEIKEVKDKRVYAGWPTLLKKSRLPRTNLAHDDRMRSVDEATGDEDYYTEDDFRVGGFVMVFGKKLQLCDCDAFTQEWYIAHKGVDQQSRRIDISEPAPPKPQLPIPPHIGIGSEEDTLESWKHLIPRKPRMDLAKWRNATGKTQRFGAKFVAEDPLHKDRLLRITWYKDDGEISVYEPPIRNSGFSAGLFLRKMRARNPETGTWFKFEEFFEGARVTIKGEPMEIISVEHVEDTSDDPTGDVDHVLATLKKKLGDASGSLRKMFRKFDLDKSQTISFSEFLAMIHYYHLGLSKGDAITVFHAFDPENSGFMSYAKFMEAFSVRDDRVDTGKVDMMGLTPGKILSREEMGKLIREATAAAERADFKAYQELLVAKIARQFKNSKTAQQVHSNFRRFDVDKDHTISKDEFRLVMGSGGLNLSSHDVDVLIDKFYEPGMESLNYEEFMRVIHGTSLGPRVRCRRTSSCSRVPRQAGRRARRARADFRS